MGYSPSSVHQMPFYLRTRMYLNLLRLMFADSDLSLHSVADHDQYGDLLASQTVISLLRHCQRPGGLW